MKSFLNQYFKTIKKLIPSKPEGTSVGLDIGAGDCKLIELRRSEDTYEIVNWAIEPVKNGNVSQAVKNILGKIENPEPSLYSSVFGKGTLIRYIDMPLMSLDDLRNSFSIEADKYFPFAQDQIYTDCYILETNPQTKQMSILCAAAKKEMIDSRVQLLKDLNINVDFIGINPIALVNVLHVVGTKEDNNVVALLDMGESVSNLTIVVDKLPRFTRDIFIGGRDITKRIANVLGVSFEEAEKYKSNPGPKMAEIIDASETAILNMVNELRLSFDYFSTEKNKEINKLLLTGGGSMFSNISEIFEKNLDVDVGKWDPLASLKISSDISADEIKGKALKLGVALGLALYKYD